jgi:general secretion pathway protein D
MAEAPAKPSAETLLAAAYRKPISIEFKDVALKQVFEVISRSAGLNFLFDKDVKTDQKTSIFLKNSSIASAVHFTLLTNQLEQQVLDANTILIYPNTPAKQKDYQEMVVRTFMLANADAKAVGNAVKTIVKSKDVVVDEKLNMLIVRDSPDAIRLAEKLVALHDVPEPEVMLEVEILEVKRTRLQDLGIKWPDALTLTPLPSTAGGTLTLRELRNLNSDTIGAAISPLTVNARQQDTDANILANPRIRARNHEKAKILIGERVPNITTTATSTGFVSESVNYVDVGLKLDVEPTVHLDNDVAIKISLEVSNIVSQIQTKSGSVAYQIGTRTASTVLRLKDGENQVLAGLINDEDRNSASKVPGLGELPVVGRLFGIDSGNNQKTEIVLSITPRLIRNVQRPDAALAEFYAGTDNSFRNRPDSGAIGGPPAANSARPAALSAPSVPAVGAPASPQTQAQAGTGSIASNSGALTPEPALQAAMLRWQGPSQARVGEAVAVQLVMQADQPVTSLPMALGFDKQALQVISVVEGDFLKQGGASSTFTSRVDPNGQILISGTRSGEGGASAAGTVATINLRPLKATENAQLQTLTVAPVGLSGRAVIVPTPAPYRLTVVP